MEGFIFFIAIVLVIHYFAKKPSAKPMKTGPSKSYLECMDMLDKTQVSIDKMGELNKQLEGINERAKALLKEHP